MTAVITPKGKYCDLINACKAYNISIGAGYYRANNQILGWRYEGAVLIEKRIIRRRSYASNARDLRYVEFCEQLKAIDAVALYKAGWRLTKIAARAGRALTPNFESVLLNWLNEQMPID